MEQQGRPSETFVVEDLLDFSLEDCGCEEAPVSSAEDSAIISLGGSFNSPHGGETYFSEELACSRFADAGLSGEDLCPPCDELAELEWLSNFVEESFHTDDLQRLQLTSPFNPSSSSSGQSGVAAVFYNFRVPGKARTKRRRLPPLSSWSSYRPVISPNASSSSPPYETSSPASSSSTARKAPTAKRKMEQYVPEGQKCLHCAATKTPQWRAGPMGPKTLCNACGVRYKSGKLAPEYRPVASPTFLPSQHSNSHRKVLELRQRKGLTAASLSPEF
ncbi:unnamed protein product [Spirodela intermedia]|uniref:GATA transcription factor n=1 Tax=Spirodela intermedia TaxID=51605 RepID=A0A7I8KZ79_SPIIN|nr:unnamed protein product [Spirodela intermedia]